VHDLRLLREHPDVLRDGLRRRGALDALGGDLERAIALETQRRQAIAQVEELLAARTAVSGTVAAAKQSGDDAKAQARMAEGREIGDRIKVAEARRAETEGELTSLLLQFPNVPLPDVPTGGESANVVVRSWGTPRLGEGLRPHWDLGETLGILDLARGAKVAGAGFVTLRGEGSRLARALVQLMLDLHTREHGYEEVAIPFAVNRAAMIGTGQFPKFEDEQYAIRDADLFLIPTAEVPITNLYRDEILDAAWLPHGFAAYSPCFRREAGAAGKDTRGLLRVHQFDKVELVRYCTPEESAHELERLTAHAEAVLTRLGLPYRVVLLAAGDTGFASAKTYDLEVWAPGVGRWLEVSSCSTCTDFQARRANIRYRSAPGKPPRFIHTLNGSGVAIPRVLAAILEHYQEPDGTVRVPDALRPYLGADRLE
jgi:seryl-tRNA synthetase